MRPEQARPTPAEGQIWSAPSPRFGRRYVRIVDVGLDYADAVECELDGCRIEPTPERPLTNRTFTIMAIGKELATPYRFERQGVTP